MKTLINSFDGAAKYLTGFIFTLVFRLITPALGLTNVSPLMATELAGSKAYGPIVGGLYGALSMVLLDVLMSKVGPWTILTAFTYGAVGVWGGYFLRHRSVSTKSFIIASIIGTLFFDLITGVIAGPTLFGQPLMAAALGQIPFTLRHLAGNIVFAMLAPWFYRSIMNNPSWKVSQLFKSSHA